MNEEGEFIESWYISCASFSKPLSACHSPTQRAGRVLIIANYFQSRVLRGRLFNQSGKARMLFFLVLRGAGVECGKPERGLQCHDRETV